MTKLEAYERAGWIRQNISEPGAEVLKHPSAGTLHLVLFEDGGEFAVTWQSSSIASLVQMFVKPRLAGMEH
jgi:hypothetical protein